MKLTKDKIMSGLLKITKDNFASLRDGGPLMVYFRAEWCGPCRVTAPSVAELAKEYAGRLSVGACDVEDDEAFALGLSVRNVPAILFFKGGAETGRIVGATPKAKIREMIDTIYFDKTD